MSERYTIRKNGRTYVLKACKGCGDEWYALPKQNRCSLCGSGLVKLPCANLEQLQSDYLRHWKAQLPTWLQIELEANR